MAGWAFIAAPLVLVVGGSVLYALARGFAPDRAAGFLPAVRVGALIVAIVTAVTALLIAAVTLLSDPLIVTFPSAPQPFELPNGVFDADADAVVVSGGFSQITAEVSGLDAWARVPLALSALFSGAMTATLAATVARLARSASDEGVFRAAISRGFFVSALVVFVAGGFSTLLNQLGSWQASVQVLELHSWAYSGSDTFATLSDLGWPEPALFEVTFDFWPLLVACALAAVGVAFRSGERLAVRADAAERELDGLV